ncbi:MAG TPA: hypothetical protein VED46_04175 [Alphaproteobacteria bacterium]|nr:hypothetical protein [Alphaproteobacteria bacterium]
MLLAVLALTGVLSWASILRNWKLGLRLLVLYLPFAGAFILLTGGSIVAHLAKDLLFVLPIYLSCAVRGIAARDLRFPSALLLSLLFLSAVVIIQMANPSVANLAVALVGAKVWLFYIPLMMVARAALASEREIVLLLRSMMALAPIPCLVGLGQYFGSSTVGYEETITAFYGDAAAGATQGFSAFHYGGELYRLPSTFQSVAHYFGYVEHSIVPTYAVLRSDPSRLWRRYALAVMVLLIAAGLLSGARAAFVFIPALLVIILVLDRVLVGAMIWAVAVPAMSLLVLNLAGLDPLAIFTHVNALGQHYATGLVVRSVVDAASNFSWGLGTGMNTISARHFVSGDARLVGFESQYAKAITELGIVGLLALVSVFGCMIVSSWNTLQRAANGRWHSTAAALTAYFVLLPIHALKGWPLDWEPANLYYWMFGAIVFALPRVGVSKQTPKSFPLRELWLSQRAQRQR